MDRLAHSQNGDGLHRALADVAPMNGRQRTRAVAAASDPSTDVYVVVAGLSNDRVVEHVQRGDFIRPRRYCDPEAIALLFGADASANGAPAADAAVAGPRERDAMTTRPARPARASRSRGDIPGSRASEEQFVSRARAELDPLLTTEPVREFVLFCIEKNRKPLPVAELADAAGVDASHLTRALAADGLPSAEEMFTWCRLLRASWFLGVLPGRSGERIAQALHFTSGAQLGDTMQRMTKMRTMDVKVRGGFAPVMAVFRNRLSQVVSTQVGPPAAGPLHG